MLSRRFGIVAVLLALLALLGPISPAPVGAEEVAVDVSALVAEAEGSPDGTIRVMVELDVDAVPEGLLTSRDATRQRDTIDAAIADVAADLDDEPEIEPLETQPSFIVDATPETLENLSQSGLVETITPEFTLKPLLEETIPLIEAGADQVGYDGSGWNVAVIDTGVSSTHPFLGGRVVAQACFASPNACPNGESVDTTSPNAGEPCNFDSGCDHGTHVAGIAAGFLGDDSRSDTPTQGVAPAAGIVAIQVFHDDGGNGAASSIDVARALDWVMQNRAELRIAAVNLSIGGPIQYAGACDSIDPTTTSLIAALAAGPAGVATVVASGNDGNAAGMSWPACLSPAIAVGASTESDAIASYSNVSPTIDLLAPGGTQSPSTIVSSATNATATPPTNTYEPKSGTSMAAPHVAGAWAIVRDALPDVPVATVLKAFRSTGVLIDGTLVADIPRIRVAEALRWLHPQPGAPLATAVPTGPNQIQLSWEDPRWLGLSSTIDSYTVTVSASSGVAVPARVISRADWLAGNQTVLYSDLPRGALYTFSVSGASVTPAAVGDAAVLSAALAELPGAPTSVVATSGSSRASVTWTAPTDGGSPITDYRVTVSPADGVASPTLSVGPATTALDFTGLTNGSTYTFTVTAVNAVGESVASAPSNEVSPRAPTSTGGGGSSGGGGGGSATTTTTTRPPTTTTTSPEPEPEPEPAPAPAPAPVPDPEPVAYPGAAVSGGRIITIRDGQVVTIASGAPAGADVVGGAVTPSGAGSWTVTSDGRVFTSGDAAQLGDVAGSTLNAPIVGIAPTPTGKGYWLLGRDGGIFTFGDAAFFGSTGGRVLNQPVVGMSSTPTGRGYWLFAGDGGIFTFGDAKFFGSTGAQRLNAPVTTMAATPSARGYWLLGADGGVFTFGDAAFFGSTGGRTDVGAIEAIVPSRTGRGYALIGFDGRIHRFGDA